MRLAGDGFAINGAFFNRRRTVGALLPQCVLPGRTVRQRSVGIWFRIEAPCSPITITS